MDQLKVALAHLNKHRFWYISGTIFLAFFGTWYKTTAWMRQETASRKSKIDASESAAVAVRGISLHPNEHSQKGMNELNERYIDQVYLAWKGQYELQKPILVWPPLGDDIQRVVDNLYPIETKVKFGLKANEEPLSADMRFRYQTFILDELPKLGNMVGAVWHSAVGKREYVPPDPILVDWAAGEQATLVQNHFTWPGGRPTTLEVMYAQEDLWVLTALLDVIRQTNGNVKGRYQAPVKTIKFIDIGRNAIGMNSRVQRFSTTGAGGGGDGFSAPMGGMNAGGMAGGGGGMMGDDKGVAAVDPAANRYVDRDFKPLTAERLRGAYDSQSPADAILAVAKRMPVRVKVRVDQRKLSRLIANFANYKLQVEIRQVRINCADGRTTKGGGGGGGAAGAAGGADAGGGVAGGFAAGAGGGFGGGGDGASAGADGDTGAQLGGAKSVGKDESPWDIDVELYGIINLYNPVDREKIGKKLDSEEGSAAAAAAAAGEPTSAG